MSARRGPGAAGRLPVLVSMVAGALVLVWVVAALAMANRGIDISDEGFYLLSYRWWSSTPRTYSGAQYLYGPVFELTGYSVAALRVFRLASILLAHAAFAWAFVTWLATTRPALLASRASSVAVALVIVASGGVMYGWLPLSPGYNDVAALTALGLAAAVLRIVTQLHRGAPAPLLPAVAIGLLLVALVIAKWASAGVVVLFLGGVLGVAAMGFRDRRWLRFALVLVLSGVVALLVTDPLVGGYRQFGSEVLEVNRLIAATANSPVELLRLYLTSGLSLLGRAGFLLVLTAVVAAAGFAAGSGRPLLRTVVFAFAPAAALVLVQPTRIGLPGGGADRVRVYSACLVAMAIVAWAAAAPHRGLRSSPARGTHRVDRAMVVMLAGLPVVQALGTGNPVYFLAVDLFACWTALMVWAVLSTPSRSLGRVLALSATTCAVLAAVDVGASGLLVHPYRADSFAANDTPIGGDGPLAGVRVSARTAEAFRSLRAAIGEPDTAGMPVMAFDEMAGLVLAVDGRSVGEAWYSEIDHARTKAGIVAACASHPLHRAPLLLFNRPPGAADRAALNACGLDLARDFVSTPLDGFGSGIVVYRPRIQTEEGSR